MMGMHGQMGPGMRGQMGGGMMGMGMMGGNATMDERRDLHDLFSNHEKIKRTVTNLPDGIRTVTESDDPQLAEVIKKHVAEMGQRVDEGRDPGLPIETPALHAIFDHKDKIKSAYEVTEKGIIVVQTSTDAAAVKALQDHAAEVTDLAKRGMVAAREAMMKNGGGMMGRGAMANPEHQH
jgi:riboflavin biosynthesis pyrimidine reductase